MRGEDAMGEGMGMAPGPYIPPAPFKGGQERRGNFKGGLAHWMARHYATPTSPFKGGRRMAEGRISGLSAGHAILLQIDYRIANAQRNHAGKFLAEHQGAGDYDRRNRR